MFSFKHFLLESNLTPVPGTQYGSNPGGVHTDSKGKKFYIKHYHNPEQAKSEVLAGKIYHHMGIHTLSPELHHDGSSVKTAWNEHVSTQKPKAYENVSKEHAHQLGKMYHGAVLTKNWDIAGLEHDNIVHDKKTGHLHAIDHGGAFHFRAMGGHKDYSSDNTEKKSLRNGDNASGHVFNHAFKQHPDAEHKSLESVKNMDMNHVHHLFKHSGLKNWKDLHSTFVKRRDLHLKSYS